MESRSSILPIQVSIPLANEDENLTMPFIDVKKVSISSEGFLYVACTLKDQSRKNFKYSCVYQRDEDTMYVNTAFDYEGLQVS